MSRTSHAARQLMRFWRSASLPGLQQGSTLSIVAPACSSAADAMPTHVRIESQWRDSGHAEFEHVLGGSSPPATNVVGNRRLDMIVEQRSAQETSLRRFASHVSIAIQESTISKDSNDNNIPGSTLPFHASSKPVDKVILDDGTTMEKGRMSTKESLQEGLRQVDYHDGVTHLTADENDDEKSPGAYLSVQVPEKVNIECNLHDGGSITIPGKVEGDVRLFTSHGSIHVKKLRGHVIELETNGPNSSIIATELLETQKLKVRTNGRFRAKQVHGSAVAIVVTADPSFPTTVDDDTLANDDEGSLVDVSALFVSGAGGATVRVHGPCQPQRRAVRIKTHHGPIQVETDQVLQPSETNPFDSNHQVYPIVELGGANGSCEVSLRQTKLHESADQPLDWSSCVVHIDSLSPDSVSLISADQGNISITLDRKLEADLRLLSVAATVDCLEESGALLAEEEDATLLASVLSNLPPMPVSPQRAPRIVMEAFEFTARPHEVSLPHVEYRDGHVENKSHEPDSRFEAKGNLASVGKIRLEGAAAQALHGFSAEDNDSSQGPASDAMRPLFAVAGTGTIRVETVSWLGAIARRYGLDEQGRELGRTASRRGRGLPTNE